MIRDIICATTIGISYVVIRLLIHLARMNAELSKSDRISPLGLLFVGVSVVFAVIVALVMLYA